MNTDSIISLATILLLPLIPAFLIYKFFPEKGGSSDEVGGQASSIGPISSLSWKLKGAFAGYFLLALLGAFWQYFQNNTQEKKEISRLEQALKLTGDSLVLAKGIISASANPVVDWHVKGLVVPGEKEGTRFFFDDGTTTKNPDGSFELIKRSLAKNGAAKPPRWICVYNPATGYKVLSLNREVNHPDIQAFNVEFNDSAHTVLIKKPIDINSIKQDSVIAVANFIESKPEIKERIIISNPEILNNAKVLIRNRKLEKLVRPQNL